MNNLPDFDTQLMHYSCAMVHMYSCMDKSNECSGADLKRVFHSLSLAFDDYLSESGLTEEEAVSNVLTFMDEHYLSPMDEEEKKYLTNILLGVEDYIEMLDPDRD